MSVREALKFLGANVRGIFVGEVGAGGVGVEVEVEEVEVGEAPVGGTEVGTFVVGAAAVTSVRVHPDAKADRQTPATIDPTTNRFPSMRPG